MDEKLIYSKEELKNKPRVFKIEGTNLFLKQKVPSKIHLGHRLQKLLYIITKNRMLIPTVLDNNINPVEFETNKIEQLAKNGIKVPNIVYKTEYYFIMEDTGESLDKVIKSDKSNEKEYIKKAVIMLAKLHLKGFAHGGSQIRNFTYKDAEVSLIDFEEDIKDEFIDEFQHRDIILFLLSLEKYKVNVELDNIFLWYEKITQNQKMKEDIITFLLKYRWLNFLNAKIFSSIKMSDVRDVLSLLNKAEKLKI